MYYLCPELHALAKGGRRRRINIEDLSLMPPEFFLNSVNRNNGFVTDQEYIINE